MAKLLAATAFCMTFVLRPVGGYVIGRIGDAIGRKITIYITTFIMAGACLTMATLYSGPICQDRKSNIMRYNFQSLNYYYNTPLLE